MAEDFRVYDNGTYKDQLGGEWLLIVSASSIDPLT